MIAAPFFHVGFADFWLADQLNSLVTALLDFQYLACFYVVNGNWLEADSKFFFFPPLHPFLLFFIAFFTKTNLSLISFLRYRSMPRAKLYLSPNCKLLAGMVSICSMFATIPRFERSISTFGQCRQIFYNIFGGDFCHTASLSCI